MKNIHSLFLSPIGKCFLLAILFLTSCEPVDSGETERAILYNVGDIGPAGGYVFYDKGNEKDGWRYIEVAPYDIDTQEWGAFNMAVTGARNTRIGAGMENTEAILAFHNDLGDFYDNPGNHTPDSDGTVAAKACLEVTINGFDNWHLPSQAELAEIYQHIHLRGLGNFITNDDPLYWTSTEHEGNTATAIDFSNGDQGYLCKQCDEVTRLRPVRYF